MSDVSVEQHFELLVTVRYDPRLLGASSQNAAIYTALSDIAYPDEVLPTISLGNSNSQIETTAIYMPHLHQKRLIDGMRHFGWQAALERLSCGGGALSSPRHFNDWVTEQVRLQVVDYSGDALRIRILLSKDSTLALQAFPTPTIQYDGVFFPPNLANPETVLCGIKTANEDSGSVWPHKATWTVYLDSEPTLCSREKADPHLCFKTTHRPVYEAARSRLSALEKREGRLDVNGTVAEVLMYSEDGYIADGSITSAYLWRDGKWVTPRVTGGKRAGAQASTTRSYALAKGLCEEADISKDSLQTGQMVWLSNGVRGFGWGTIMV